jgi:predicted TIM-barrel fold metal-dependent hydrolase
MSLDMPKIDCHVHVGAYNVALIRCEGFEELAQLMQRANIELACLSHTEAVFHSMSAGNEKLFRELPRYPQMRGYIYVDPLRPEESLAEIRRYLGHPQLVGIKSRSEYHGVPFDAPAYRQILELAQKHRLPLLHHTFSAEVAQQMARLLRHYDIPCIVAHSGGPAWRTVVPLLAELPNTYMDLCASIIDAEKARTIISWVGAERVLFGSDMNLISPFWTIAMFEAAGLSEAQLQLIYRENARRILPLGL